MQNDSNLNFSTLCVHGGQEPEKSTGAVMMPIFQTSTYAQKSPGVHNGYEYSRTHNPTRTALEKNLASIEYAKFGFCFASGCAAITAIMLSLRPDEHIVSMDDLYGGTHRLFNKIFADFGLKYSYIDLSDHINLEKNITENTKLVWLETPTNPLLKLVDITKIAEICKKNNILLAVDNTFATPALQNPLRLGADIVVHSTTKYIGGHSDVVGGAILTNDAQMAEKIAFISNSTGGIPGPMDCFLLLRGIKTLDLRMQKHCENALFIANKLADHSQIEKVYYPGLHSHPQFLLAQAQMKWFGGMISFIVKGGLEKAKKVCERTKLFTCAESLGGVESLIEHPATMTHYSLEPQLRNNLGISDGLIRISVGIEDIKDLWRDLKQAIE